MLSAALAPLRLSTRSDFPLTQNELSRITTMNQESLATPSVPRRSIAAIILSGKRYAFRVEGGITKGDLVKPPHPAEPERSDDFPITVRPKIGDDATVDRDPSHGLATERTNLGEVLPKYYFLSQLRREKRRTERTRSPLSVALFDFRGAVSGFGDSDEESLRLLQKTKRDADIVGYLDKGLIGVILPDTNEQGTQRFIQKVSDRAQSLKFSFTSGTYPDQVFENLGKGNEEPSVPEALFLDDSAEPRLPHYVKRMIDVVGALAALVLASPVMIIAAICVAATSPGPILFKQIRLGRRGAPFVFYKFRSMYCDADSKLHRDYVTGIIKSSHDAPGPGNAGKAWAKLESDPRIIPIGRFLRKTSIDELPQLFCVLKGDMSLVGPRPPLPYEGEAYQPWHLRRVLDSKPGITGLWQVTGRGRMSFNDMVRLDLRYICDWSVTMDVKILLRTILVVLKRQGAK